MASQTKHRTRRERRTHDTTTHDIPTAHPSRTPPKEKTLYELAEERQASLFAQAEALNAARATQRLQDQDQRPHPHPSSNATPPTSSWRSALVSADDPPYVTALLYATTLSMVHFTLTLLVYQQYSQSIPSLRALLRESALYTLSALFLIVYIAHTPPFSPRHRRFWWIRQGVFCAVSVAAGVKCVELGNEGAYLAVMKRTPGLGVLWVWSVLELDWRGALLGVGAVGGWAWWKGWGVW